MSKRKNTTDYGKNKRQNTTKPERPKTTEPQLTTVYFYDNSINNKRDKDLCPNIKFVWVDASGNCLNLPDASGSQLGHTYEWEPWKPNCIIDIKQKTDDNKFLNQILDYESDAWYIGHLFRKITKTCKYDSRAGINVIGSDFQLESFVNHVEERAQEPNVTFVFDWDRTLQVMEGMFKLDIQEYVNYFNEHIPRHSDRGPWTPESTIDALSVYHAGGEARLEELRKMFVAIGNKEVFILTSSDVAVDYKGVYAAILDNWGCQNLRGVHYSLANKGVTKYTYMNKHMKDVLHVGVPGLPTAQETVDEFKLRF